MFSDSSSGEEEFEKFKEAIDKNFLPQNLYENDTRKKKCEESMKPSLRNQNQLKILHNPFAVKVTPEFQKHVSDHLSRLLDELIDDTDIVLRKKKLKREHSNSGVKLLHSSKNYVLLTDEKDIFVSSKNIYKRKCLDKIDFEERAKEVAVSPEWILSKQEIRHWAPETKGEVEILKLDNCCNRLKNSNKKCFDSKKM